MVPGLIVTQHSGEGKANQYFLRGFNLDHGTDLAITVDGMPVNMPTHGHGQGYADINFLIPELVQSVNVRKGPYFADKGDFASAGAVGIDYVNKLPKNIAEVTFGSFGYQRALAAGSTAVGDGTLLAAFEANKYNGPWDVPDNVRKLNGVLRYSQGTADRRLHADGDGLFQRLEFDRSGGAARHRSGRDRPLRLARPDRWRHLEPLLAVEQLGAIERVRPEQGQRLCDPLVAAASSTTSPTSSTIPSMATSSARPTAARSMGFNASHAFEVRFAGIETQTRVGLQTRGDDIHVGLFKTLQRETLSTVRDDSVQGRQCRPVGGYDGALDRLAAHHGRPPRGLFRRPRRQRHAGKFRQRAGVR